MVAAMVGALALPLAAPAQGPSAPPMLGVPSTDADDLSSCVARYGNTGCAARLYARLLCEVVGQSPIPDGLQQRLDRDYEDAAIDFSGISAAQVESVAVRYYAPMLCPERSRQIQELFAQIAEPAG